MHIHEQDHCHAHEHTHADGTTHTHEHHHEHHHDHEHEHEHHHDHEHLHDHEHHHDHEHAHEHSGTPREQLLAILNYMVGHNASHVQETKDLAEQLKEDRPDVYAKIADAVAEFEKGNALLSQALEELKK